MSPFETGTTTFSGDGVSQVSLPVGWSQQTGLNEQAALQAGDPTSQAYLIVITESKDDFSDDTTIDVHSSLTRSHIANSLIGGWTSGPKRLT
ncbi:MAG: hypothetical protein ACREJB_02575, partial [Planctomycetaceae bacterium]